MQRLIVFCLLFSSCSLLERATRALEDTKIRYDDVVAKLKEVDKNNDGWVTLPEVLAALFGVTSIGGIALGVRNAKSDKWKARMDEAISAMNYGRPG